MRVKQEKRKMGELGTRTLQRHEEILHYVGQEKFQDLALKHFLQTGGTS